MTLAARGVRLSLGGREILRGVDLEVADGELLAILGPNGSGKSTLLRAIGGMLAPDAGEVLLDGTPLASMRRAEIARRLAIVPQSAPIPSLITVREHVWLGRHPHRGWIPGPGWLGGAADRERDRRVVEEAMAFCDVATLADRTVETLSGGERQRVRIATALAQDARHLVLDEPLTGLDIQHQLDLLRLLAMVQRDRARTVVAVLHDIDLAVRHMPRVALLDRGRIVADGPPADVLTPAAFAGVFRVDGRIGRDAVRGDPIVVCHPLE
jgi:iron complex transport system ATP-binding protein